MTKALVISDTHGLIQEVREVVHRDSYDMIFHCGDYCTDEEVLPFSQMKMVRGNNDFSDVIPMEQVVEWSGLRIFMAHGHTYQVYDSLLGLKYKAEEVGADIVLFGHTHYPVAIHDGGTVFINPGSLRQPRGFTVPTYVVLKVDQQEEKKIQISITYYDDKHQKVEQLSKCFSLSESN